MDPDQGKAVLRAAHGIVDIPSIRELELLGHEFFWGGGSSFLVWRCCSPEVVRLGV